MYLACSVVTECLDIGRISAVKVTNIYGSQGFKNIVRVDAETIIIGENLSYESSTVSGDEEVPESIAHSYRFKFDHVYDMDSRQTEVYETTAKEAVYNTLKVGV